MAMYGFDVPFSKKPVDVDRRREIFKVVSMYCFSQDDLVDIREYPEPVKDLWLWSFTNSQSVMMRKLLINTKDYFRRYFPDDGHSPKASLGKMIGLEPGQTILDRYNT